MNLLKGRHFKYDVIVWAVRWCWKYGQGIQGEIRIITDNLLAF